MPGNRAFEIFLSLFGSLFGGALLVYIFFALNQAASKKYPKVSKYGLVMRYSLLAKTIFLICVFFFAGIMILATIFSNDTVTWSFYAIFATLLFISLIYSFYIMGWKAFVSEDRVIFLRPWLKPKTVRFSDISYAEIALLGLGIKFLAVYSKNKKLFCLDSLMVGYDMFDRKLNELHINRNSGGTVHIGRL